MSIRLTPLVTLIEPGNLMKSSPAKRQRDFKFFWLVISEEHQ